MILLSAKLFCYKTRSNIQRSVLILWFLKIQHLNLNFVFWMFVSFFSAQHRFSRITNQFRFCKNGAATKRKSCISGLSVDWCSIENLFEKVTNCTVESIGQSFTMAIKYSAGSNLALNLCQHIAIEIPSTRISSINWPFFAEIFVFC